MENNTKIYSTIVHTNKCMQQTNYEFKFLFLKHNIEMEIVHHLRVIDLMNTSSEVFVRVRGAD